MPSKRRLNPADQAQRPETWAAGAVQLRVWITPDDKEPNRPYLIIVLDLDHGFILANDMVERTPTHNQLLKVVQQAITRPPRGIGSPRRPERLDPLAAHPRRGGIAEERGVSTPPNHMRVWPTPGPIRRRMRAC